MPFYKFSKIIKSSKFILNIRITNEITKPQLKLLTKKYYRIPSYEKTMKKRIRKKIVEITVFKSWLLLKVKVVCLGSGDECQEDKIPCSKEVLYKKE